MHMRSHVYMKSHAGPLSADSYKIIYGVYFRPLVESLTAWSKIENSLSARADRVHRHDDDPRPGVYTYEELLTVVAVIKKAQAVLCRVGLPRI